METILNCTGTINSKWDILWKRSRYGLRVKKLHFCPVHWVTEPREGWEGRAGKLLHSYSSPGLPPRHRGYGQPWFTNFWHLRGERWPHDACKLTSGSPDCYMMIEQFMLEDTSEGHLNPTSCYRVNYEVRLVEVHFALLPFAHLEGREHWSFFQASETAPVPSILSCCPMTL